MPLSDVVVGHARTMNRYSPGHHESVLRSHRWRTVDNSAAYLRPFLTAGIRVLDVGCGPGTITAEFADLVGPEGDVLGVDASSSVIELAVDAAAERDGTRPRYAVGDVMALDLPDGSFDVVHAHQVLQHLDDPVGALREMARVAGPGGLVAVRDADYSAMTWHPQLPGLANWVDVYRAVARSNGAEPDAGRRLLEWAHRAGFEEVTSSASVWCFATQGDRDWWGGLQADRILHSDVAHQAVEEFLTDRAGLERISAAWLEWAVHESAWFAVLHGELLYRVPGSG